MSCKTATGNEVMTYLGGVCDTERKYSYMPVLVYDDKFQKPVVEFYYADEDTILDISEDAQYLVGTYDPSDYVDYYDLKADTIRYFAINGSTEKMRANLKEHYNDWYKFDKNYIRV